MTSFAYWSSLAPKGTFMCQDCFNNRHTSEAWVDEHGDAWDICEGCKLHEGMTRVQLRLKEEVVELIEEIQDLERELKYHKATCAGLLRTCEVDERDIAQLQNENASLREELHQHKVKRTLGGPPHGYTPDWRP